MRGGSITVNRHDNHFYEDRLVAFIDILGFAKLVQSSATADADQDKVRRLIAVCTVFDWFTTQMLDELIDSAFFSDTFVLSATISQTLYLIRETGNLCRYLLLQGLPCRGAIALGLLHHRERIIIGPALVDAYRAEQSVAIYPRIVVDDETLNNWIEECASSTVHADLRPLLKQDTDGQHYLDIFDPLWSNAFLPWTNTRFRDVVPTDPIEFLTAAFREVSENLKANADDQRVRDKYEWLATKIQSYATASGLELRS